MDKVGHCSGEDRQDKGSKNKRKLAHPSIVPTNLSSSLIEFPRYELTAEISQSPKPEFELTEMVSDRFREEPEVQMHELMDWNDPIASELEELLLSNLQALFRSAIRQIVELGYNEHVAEKAISRKGLYIGEGDPVSHIVHDTLNVLKGNYVATLRDIVFDDFQHLLHYSMVEMISMLREVRPSLTVGEAMWLLLIFDLNISQACAVGEEHLSDFCKLETSTSSSNPQSNSDVESSDATLVNCSAPNFQKDSSSSNHNYMSEPPKFGCFLNSPKNQNAVASEGVKLEAENASLPYSAEKSSVTSGECGRVAPQLSASEGKLAPSSKRHNRKELAALRQKFLHMEKTYRACGKGGFKSGKLTSVSGYVVEKKLKPPSDVPNHMKCGSSNMTSTKVATVDESCYASTNAACALPAGDSFGQLPTKDAISTSPQVDAKTSTSDKNLKPKSELSTCDANKILDYAGIPYDEALCKYVPRDQKDELILKLVPRLQEFQVELESWNNWTKQKVMQVTHRLNKDQAELKSLRKEKQEAELFKKEKKILEDNAMKRISEMENAIANTRSQIENADSAARTLEAENYLLKKELGAAKLLAVKSMASHQQALEREQMALKRAQSWESQKGLLLDELDREKRKLANLQQKVDKEKNLQAKVEGQLEQERVAKEKLLNRAASIRKETQQLEARAKVEEDMIRKKAANEMQKYVQDIAKLEKELADLKLKSESAKIAALRRGIDGRSDSSSINCKSTPTVKGQKNSDVSQTMVSYQDKSASGSLRREQECVMCLSEEMSVVFLPCAHQVVCEKCNELHEKQGMKDCPSCRTPIQLRIHARFPGRKQVLTFLQELEPRRRITVI